MLTRMTGRALLIMGKKGQAALLAPMVLGFKFCFAPMAR
jgi:hypothetical protein